MPPLGLDLRNLIDDNETAKREGDPEHKQPPKNAENCPSSADDQRDCTYSGFFPPGRKRLLPKWIAL